MTTFIAKDFNFWEYKAFFCFWTEQFEAGKKEHWIDDKEKLVNLWGWLIGLKSNYKEMWKAFSLHNKTEKERKKEFNKSKKWEEITEKLFFEMLEVLPPEQWRGEKGSEIFRMSEYNEWTETNHYKRKWKLFYKKIIDITSYKNILDLI